MKTPREYAFAIFDNMKNGEFLKVLAHAPNKPDLFIQMGKDYIDEGGAIEFNDDYTRIRKITSMAEVLEAEYELFLNRNID
jgi:hypothetical protein